MKRTEAPKKQPVPFAIGGLREELLPATPAGGNTASYINGFPPITMVQKNAGGLPPKGQDMNQILYELSNLSRWASSGAINSFDSSFSTGVAGYPKGAQILGDDGSTIYISTIDDNTSNPNTGGAGWFNQTNAYLMVSNNLSEISSAGASAQSSAMSNIGLARIGIGSTVVTRLPSLDWQQFDFTTGANYFVNNTDWTNAPAGISYASVTGVSISVDYVSAGNRIALTIIPDTGLNADYVVYRALSVGAKGSRVFTVRQDFTSADTIPISNGGLGATTAAGGRANLGLGTAAVADVGTGTNQIPDMASFNLNSIQCFRLPTGHIVQFGGGETVNGGFTQSYQVPFPNQCLALIGVVYGGLGQRVFITTNTTDRTAANMNAVDINGVGVTILVGYIAIGI